MEFNPEQQEERQAKAAQNKPSFVEKFLGYGPRAHHMRQVTAREYKQTDLLIHEKLENIEKKKVNPDNRPLTLQQAKLYRHYGSHRRERAEEKFAEFKVLYKRKLVRNARKERDARIRAERERLEEMAKGEMEGREDKPPGFIHRLIQPARRSDPRARGLARRG